MLAFQWISAGYGRGSQDVNRREKIARVSPAICAGASSEIIIFGR
jgi:hypothetical protein